jgi:hypothetical protein
MFNNTLSTSVEEGEVGSVEVPGKEAVVTVGEQAF